MERLLCLLMTFGVSASALEIPKGLSYSDEQTVVETLGLNAAPKMLTNPYPLGGYSGFEIGYSVEFIDARDINHLGCAGNSGCQSPNNDEFTLSRITIGKGLYRDVDIFFSFAPPVGGTDISDYGGELRWAFYQAAFLPLTFSAVVHGNRMNLQDEFMNQNFGAELIIGATTDNFSVYFGGGRVYAQGTFPAGAVGAPASPTVASVGETHAVLGFSAKYQNLFSAAEIDHYRDTVYSAKIGMRF